MRDRAFTDEEIIKALDVCRSGYCISKECPFYDEKDDDDIGACTSRLSTDALALINRQKAEIEQLQKQLILKNNALLSIVYVAKRIPQTVCDNCYPDFNREVLPVNVFRAREGYEAVDALVEQIVKEASV